MRKDHFADIAIIGAGIAGIAAAYYLSARRPDLSIVLVDDRVPLSLTSSRSGDNYRNWWPHPVMTEFTDLSIDLLEQVVRDTGNAISMSRRGYLLATRRTDVEPILSELRCGYPDASRHPIRVHERDGTYEGPAGNGLADVPRGVDVVCGPKRVQSLWPSLAEDVSTIVHIRRGGDIDGQALGQYLLAGFREHGGRRIGARLEAVRQGSAFELALNSQEGTRTLRAERVVIAAGPFIRDVAALFELDIEVENYFQQKVALTDVRGAVPRDLPFTIDLDEQSLNWSREERQQLEDDRELAWLVRPLPGGVHCRPDGGLHGNRVKLGWALNTVPGAPAVDLESDPAGHDFFPEIVLRAASNLQPALAAYIDGQRRELALYGGYYTMTRENWPLIGPTAIDGLFIVGALSGFGTMAACAAGSIVADWMTGGSTPRWAQSLSIMRYQDAALMRDLRGRTNRGIL